MRATQLNPVHRTAMLMAAIGLSGAVLPANTAPATNPSAPTMLTPDEITWGPCAPSVPSGAQCAMLAGTRTAANALFAYRIRMPDEFSLGPHFHPSDEHVIVLKGVFNVGLGDTMRKQGARAFPAGSFVVIPKGVPHYAWTTGETTVQVYAIGPWGLTVVDPATRHEAAQ